MLEYALASLCGHERTASKKAGFLWWSIFAQGELKSAKDGEDALVWVGDGTGLKRFNWERKVFLVDGWARGQCTAGVSPRGSPLTLGCLWCPPRWSLALERGGGAGICAWLSCSSALPEETGQKGGTEVLWAALLPVKEELGINFCVLLGGGSRHFPSWVVLLHKNETFKMCGCAFLRSLEWITSNQSCKFLDINNFKLF